MQTVNLCVNDTTVIGTADIDVPDQRYPGDLASIAPLLQIGSRYFTYVPQPFYGPPPVEAYIEVIPVLAKRSSFNGK
jgi:hypothetical protein